jgi:hypothetical protein
MNQLRSTNHSGLIQAVDRKRNIYTPAEVDTCGENHMKLKVKTFRDVSAPNFYLQYRAFVLCYAFFQKKKKPWGAWESQEWRDFLWISGTNAETKPKLIFSKILLMQTCCARIGKLKLVVKN